MGLMEGARRGGMSCAFGLVRNLFCNFYLFIYFKRGDIYVYSVRVPFKHYLGKPA